MSLLWKTAVEGDKETVTEKGLPITLRSVPAHGKEGWLYEARVAGDHPLAKEHGTLAGYAHCSSEDHPDPEEDYWTKIHMVETNPAYQRQGVGRALVQHAIDQAGFRGVTHGGVTLQGSDLWHSVTGERVHPTRWADKNNDRTWRYA